MTEPTVFVVALIGLINHHRNRMDLAVTDPDTRNGFRSHFAVTDVEGHSQAFVEWTKSPFENRHVHFSEQMNARGTAAHEAEHANDAALGKPSQNDPEFDRLYRQEANKVSAQQVEPSKQIESQPTKPEHHHHRHHHH